jgi:hypothetical protein
VAGDENALPDLSATVTACADLALKIDAIHAVSWS